MSSVTLSDAGVFEPTRTATAAAETPVVSAADAFVARFVLAVQVCSTRQRALVKHCVQTAFEDESL